MAHDSQLNVNTYKSNIPFFIKNDPEIPPYSVPLLFGKDADSLLRNHDTKPLPGNQLRHGSG